MCRPRDIAPLAVSDVETTFHSLTIVGGDGLVGGVSHGNRVSMQRELVAFWNHEVAQDVTWQSVERPRSIEVRFHVYYIIVAVSVARTHTEVGGEHGRHRSTIAINHWLENDAAG